MTKTPLFAPDPARGWLPWGALSPILLILFVVLPVLLTDGTMEAQGWATAKGDPIGRVGWIVFLLVPFAMTGALVLAWVRWIERRSMASIGLTPGGAGAFFRGLGIGMAMILAVVSAIWLAGGYRSDGLALAFATPSALAHIGVLLLCFVVQAGVEEIIFRGWLMSVLARKFNIAVAFVVVSLVFTLLHYSPRQEWQLTLASFLFSAFACAWAIRSGQIWGVMGWHAGWNWLLACGFELPVTGLEVHLPALLVKLVPQGSVLLTGGAEGPEGSLVCSAFFIAAIVFVARRTPARRDIAAEAAPAA